MADRPVPIDDSVSLEHESPRDSSLRVDVTFSVGYVRQRGTTTDRWEARVSSVGLMVAGAAVVLIILLFLLPKVLAGL